MKPTRWIIALIMLIGTSFMAKAQTPKTPAQQAKDLQTQLQLTDAQTAKVTAVYTDIEKQTKGDQAKIKSWTEKKDMKSLSDYMVKQLDNTKGKIVPILTPAQKGKYEQMIDQAKKTLAMLATMQN